MNHAARHISRLASIALAILAVPHAARAEDVRVVLATTDAELVRAVDSTLAPWQVRVVTIDVEPGSSMPGSADRGREIAVAHGGAAVVWISASADGSALWMYDHASDRVVTRRLPSAPPFDEVTAAAVALSIKTLLRHSNAAPPSERLEPAEPRRGAVVRLEVSGGARAFATSPADVEPRVGLAVSLWPAESLGLALGARTGSGVGIASASFGGRLLSIEAFIGGRARWAPIALLDLGLALEAGASFELLEGEVLPAGRGLSQVEVDPTISLAAELGLRPLDALRLGVRVGAQASPRTRSYLVRGQPIFETAPVRLVAELVLEIPLDGGTVMSR